MGAPSAPSHHSARRGSGARSWAKGPRTLSPRPASHWSSDFCNCWHFGGLVQAFAIYGSLLAVWKPQLPSPLRFRAPTLGHCSGRAAGCALSTKRRLGTCLAILVGLLLNATGKTFSGKHSHSWDGGFGAGVRGRRNLLDRRAGGGVQACQGAWRVRHLVCRSAGHWASGLKGGLARSTWTGGAGRL